MKKIPDPGKFSVSPLYKRASVKLMHMGDSPHRYVTCKTENTNEKCPFSLYPSVITEIYGFRRDIKGNGQKLKSKQNNSKRKMTSHFT